MVRSREDDDWGSWGGVPADPAILRVGNETLARLEESDEMLARRLQEEEFRAAGEVFAEARPLFTPGSRPSGLPRAPIDRPVDNDEVLVPPDPPRLIGRQSRRSRMQECRYGWNCTRVDCWFSHPEGRGIDRRCHSGPNCQRQGCPYIHPWDEERVWATAADDDEQSGEDWREWVHDDDDEDWEDGWEEGEEEDWTENDEEEDEEEEWYRRRWDEWSARRRRPNRSTPAHVVTMALNWAAHSRETCPITMDPITVQEGAMAPCGHFFLRHAILQHLQDRRICPVCREYCEADDLRP